MKTIEDYEKVANAVIDRKFAVYTAAWKKSGVKTPPDINIGEMVRAKNEAFAIAIMEDMQEIAENLGATEVAKEIEKRITSI